MSEDHPQTTSQRDLSLRLFIFIAVVYLYFFGGSGFNQNASFDLTRALVEQRTIRIDSYASNTGDVSIHRGHLYSNKPPGLALFAAVPYSVIYLAERIGGIDSANPLVLTLNLYLCTFLVCGLSGAAIAALIYLEAKDLRVTEPWAVATALLMALATPLFAYSTMLFMHVPNALFFLLAFRAVFGAPPRYGLAGFWMGMASLVNYLSIPVALGGVILVLRSSQRGRDLARYVAGGAPFAALLGVYHTIAFGSPLRSAVAATNPAFHSPGALLDVFQLPRIERLIGITVSPYRGLFFISPILLLAIPGAWRWWRSGDRPVELRTIGVVALYLLIVNSSFNGWHGGYTIGPRYLIPVIPFLALALMRMAGSLRTVWMVLGAISLLFNFASAAVDPQPPDSLRDPIGQYLLPRLALDQVGARAPVWLRDFYTGHTSTNRVAADEDLPFKRHPPGSPSSEWASFNLGEIVFGPGELGSILPIVIWLVGGGWWLMRRAAQGSGVWGPGSGATKINTNVSS